MKLRILIADDEQPARYAMKKALACSAYEVDEAEDGRPALDAIRNGSYDLVFLDLSMPNVGGQDVLRSLGNERIDKGLEIIVVTADETVQTAVECIRLGASDYINKPYEVEQIRAIARRAARRADMQRQVNRLQQELDQRNAFGAMVGVSRTMRDLFARMQRAARAPVDLLIEGETGTGKELIAREIHQQSDRADGPFVAVNTAAIAETLAESELFGHVRGAFTGATDDRPGCFQQASGGTLFLDEIGDMPLPAQTKILRALQQRIVQPVGSARPVNVDVRVISATHQNLSEAIEQGLFRSDLYYRIKGIQLSVPPLRRRREDIVLLANYFLDREAIRCHDRSLQLSHRAIDILLTHRWPGNVRELEQAITAAVAMSEGSEITPADLQLQPLDRKPSDFDWNALLDLSLTDAKSQLVEAFERRSISAALERNDYNVSAAARQLGIHRQSLQQKMAQLGIQRPPVD